MSIIVNLLNGNPYYGSITVISLLGLYPFLLHVITTAMITAPITIATNSGIPIERPSLREFELEEDFELDPDDVLSVFVV